MLHLTLKEDNQQEPYQKLEKISKNHRQPEQQRVIDAAEESKRKRAEKKQRLLKEKFGKLKEDIDLTQEPVELEDVELEEGRP